MTTNLMPISDLAIPPGEYLEEVLEALGMNKEELAQRMGRPAPKLSAIFSGKKVITPETALQLERATGIGAHIWSSLEAEYRLIRARRKINDARQKLKCEEKQVTDYCYPTLKRLGLVKDTRVPAERAEELRRYFGVSALSAIADIRRYLPAFRQKNGSNGTKPQSVAAWLRYGEIRGREASCATFDRNALLTDVRYFRKLTRQPISKALPTLEETLAKVGVVLVLSPHFPNTHVNGAVFWLGQNKAVLMLTCREHRADIFWFTLFHALGHLLLHAKQGTIIEDGQTTPDESLREQEADEFAQDALIPREEFFAFKERGVFSCASVERFSKEICVHPAIVFGRIRHEKLLPCSSALKAIRQRSKISFPDTFRVQPMQSPAEV